MSNDKRISDTMEQALNKANDGRSHTSAGIYCASSWAEVNNYPGIADFFYKHSAERTETICSNF